MEVDNTAWKKKLTPQQRAEYKAEKREEMQNLFKKIDDGVKAVFESDSYKKCLRYMSKFTNYSAGNCILIMLQKPDASLVAAFGKWKELGRTINKGEKGIAILAPMSFKSKELKEQLVTDSNGQQIYNADGTEKKEKVEVEQTSKRITVSHSCVIEAEFINGVIIKNETERSEGNGNST